MAEELSVIGKPENRDKQTYLTVTGKLDFAADKNPTGKLFGRLLLSTVAHGQITSIDTSKAEALEGVEAVITYEDNPLWGDGIFHWGQQIAAVAATDPNIAAYAVSLIDVEYDERPFVIDPDEALKPDAPLVGILPESNVSTVSEVERGDIEAGFTEADMTIEETVGWTGYFQHNNIEPCSAVAWWVKDHLYVWTTNQAPFMARSALAGSLQMPMNRCHVFSHGTGTGYGDKGGDTGGVTAALLAKKAGKPVELHFSRRENVISRSHQNPQRATVRMGAKSDGTLTAIDAMWYGDGGINSRAPVSAAPWGMRTTFKCPNGRWRVDCIVTNKGPGGYWRCVQDPAGTFILGVVMDRMAEKLGMDPLEFRLKNLVDPEAAHQDTGKPLSSNGTREILESMRDATGWSAEWHAPGTKTLTDGRMHGLGISAHVDGHGSMMGIAGAIVNLTADGTALINAGISRAGGGTNTAMCHIVAETLGMNYDDVNTGDWGNTDVCSDGGMQAGSTRVITLGAAFKVAAEDARAQLFEIAAGRLGVTPEELDAKEGVIFVKADPSKSMPHAAVLGGSGFATPPLIGRGNTWPQVLQRPVGDFPAGTPCETKGVCGSAVEVAVDTETGEVEILKHINACDMGRAVFYQGSKNQIEGGIELQYCQALLWEQILDPSTGATLSTDHLEHRWQTSLDVHPDRAQAIIIETDDACGPYGAKGLGEPPVASYVCIASAIYNAIGVWIAESPIYPWKILKALGKA